MMWLGCHQLEANLKSVFFYVAEMNLERCNGSRNDNLFYRNSFCEKMINMKKLKN